MNPTMMKTPLGLPSPSQFETATSNEPKSFKLDLARSLHMHKRAAMIVAAVVTFLLIAFALSRKPYYTSEALIYVQPMRAQLITDATGGTYDQGRYDTYIQQQLLTIVRSDILAEALHNLPIGVWQVPGESDDTAIARLRSNLKVEREMGSYQLSVGLSGDNPVALARIVNAVTDAYIRRERLDELAQSNQQLQVLTTERERLETSLLGSRQEQAQLSTSLGVADTSAPETGNPYDVQLGELRTKLAIARADRAVAEAQLASITTRDGGTVDNLSAAAQEGTATSPLRATIAQQKNTLLSQMVGLTPKNPLYQQDLEQIKKLDSIANDMQADSAQQVQAKLKLAVDQARKLESGLTQQLMQQTAIATSATPKLQRAADLAASLTRLQARYTEVDNAISAIELEHSSSGLVHLSLAAVPPSKPKASKKILILAMALPVGLIFGSLVAVGLHKLDQKLYIGTDVEEVLGFQPMSVLPDSVETSSKAVDECLLRLVAGIDQAHRAGGARTFVFTSVSPDVDITELIASLARKMDRVGYRTMILKASSALKNLAGSDEDLEKPWDGDTRLIAKPEDTRLTHVRRESLVVENLERLRENIDLLFIEALPLLTSAEAEFAARLADVTVLVAKSAKSTRKELSAASGLVRRLNIAGVAAVLTDLSIANADHEFAALIREAERRPSEAQYDSGFPQSIYDEHDLGTHDHKTSANAAR